MSLPNLPLFARTFGALSPIIHEPRCGSNREDRDADGAGRSRDFDTKPYRHASARFGRNRLVGNEQSMLGGTGLGGPRPCGNRSAVL